jgi:uncharacterized membrane protein YhhN
MNLYRQLWSNPWRDEKMSQVWKALVVSIVVIIGLIVIFRLAESLAVPISYTILMIVGFASAAIIGIMKME